MQPALNRLLHRMEHVVHIKSHALASLFLASFLPTTQECVPSIYFSALSPLFAFFSASSPLFAFTPPAVTPVTFPKHEADKEQGRA